MSNTEIKTVEDLQQYIQKCGENSPDLNDTCNLLLERINAINKMTKGEESSVESTNTYQHYITLSVAVGVPSNMDIGQLLEEIKKIEALMNENSNLSFKIKS